MGKKKKKRKKKMRCQWWCLIALLRRREPRANTSAQPVAGRDDGMASTIMLRWPTRRRRLCGEGEWAEGRAKELL